MSLEPIANWMYFVRGAWNIMTSNIVFAIPIAMTILYFAYQLIDRVRKTIK